MNEQLIKKLNLNKEIAKKYDKNKSVTEILDNFRCMTPEFEEFSEKILKSNYSSANFFDCTTEEQTDFINKQLLTLECLVCNSIFDKHGSIWNWYDIFSLIHDKDYYNTDKKNRKAVYPVSNTERPTGNAGYKNWNGLQIIDLDIKDADKAKKIRKHIEEDLSKYQWFLGVCESASHKSLHVWTKITPLSITPEKRKIEYICNFRHKYSYIYIDLLKYCKEIGYDNVEIQNYIDLAMCKPQQAIYISSDYRPFLNTNFIDTRLDVNFDRALEIGAESVDWIIHPDLKQIFAKYEWFANDDFIENENVNLADVTNINDIDESKNIKKHYKHSARWQIANTLTNIYGKEKAKKYILSICKDTSTTELLRDINTAATHNKPISIWAVKELNKYHGFNIKINNMDELNDDKEEKLKAKEDILIEHNKGEINLGNSLSNNSVVLNIEHNQFLSDIKDSIISNLAHMTLLEAGAGYGKTEMIKALKAKTLLILPFTSTIKSKIEKDEVTSDWLYFYGNKRPTIDDIMSNKSIAMTIDKFSRLNTCELDIANYEYIVLDESHLLFTSSYRDVMSPTIQRLANCKAKIILMTGTPTGEFMFFPHIKHIKVIKDDTRIKDIELHFCPRKKEQFIEMCKSMAEDIGNNKKILFPTNNGTLYYDEIVGLVKQILFEKGFNREINTFYYKKSNFGDKEMDDINFNKTFGENDLVACTTYLSVGVDITDRLPFVVYFDKEWIPQDIEQFANRIRKSDLYIKMFLPRRTDDGEVIDYTTVNPLDLSINENELLFLRDVVVSCNDNILRSYDEMKYSPMIQQFIVANKCVKYDENMAKYSIDETTYKLKIFEDNYSTYNKQLTVMLDGLKYYGYTIGKIEHEEIVSPERELEIDNFLKACKNRRYNENTRKTFELIDELTDNNIEIFKEVLSGNYDLLKSENYNVVREENNIHVKDIEIVEKNIPHILSFYKNYDIKTIRNIFEYCLEEKQNRINYTKLVRIRKFISIVNSIKKQRLDFPVHKFIIDSRKWALEHSTTTTDEVSVYLKIYATKYANSIAGLVIDDVKFLEHIYELLTQLWDVIVIHSRSKNGVITISPFELLWKTKENMNTIYCNETTKMFFADELLNEFKDEPIDTIDLTVELPELELTKKYKLEDVKDEIKNIVHKEYDYFDYSEKDGSNERFLEKQKNTSQFRDTIFSVIENAETEKTNDSGELF